MGRIIVYIRGGVFQGAIGDQPGQQIMVVDYDDEKEQPRPRAFQAVPRDATLFEQTLKHEE